jgi:hypothetical protein
MVIFGVDNVSVDVEVEVMSPMEIGHFDGLGYPSQMEVGKKGSGRQPHSTSSFVFSCHVTRRWWDSEETRRKETRAYLYRT